MVNSWVIMMVQNGGWLILIVNYGWADSWLNIMVDVMVVNNGWLLVELFVTMMVNAGWHLAYNDWFMQDVSSWAMAMKWLINWVMMVRHLFNWV